MNSFVIVLTLAFVGQMVHCWDQGLRDYILNIHNDMRKRPKACEMHKMEYDMDLERQAKSWAQRCVFKHEMKKGRGENLAFNTNKLDDKKLLDIATDDWYNEIKDFRYGQNSCFMSCHYTQLVWSTTNKVGCYAHQCPNLVGGARDAFYLVCFYTPMGNWMGEQPYKTTCPAPCLKGQKNEGGLCVGEAVKECKDTNASCGNWAASGECQKNPKYMKSKCQKSCNSCPCKY